MQVTSSNLQVSSSNSQVTCSNPQVKKTNARVMVKLKFFLWVQIHELRVQIHKL